MTPPRLLDLFCGAGGAAMGYHRAGFEIIGVDVAPQPDYPFAFVQADALEVLRNFEEYGYAEEIDAVHASPPCQHASSLRFLRLDRDYPQLIGPTRELLLPTGLPYVIENVAGAVLLHPYKLCGSMLGTNVRRHRYFETNFPLIVPSCAHGQQGELLGVYGNSDGSSQTKKGYKRGPRQVTTTEARTLMAMPWASRRRGLTQAIQPDFTELIGHQLMAHVRAVAS